MPCQGVYISDHTHSVVVSPEKLEVLREWNSDFNKDAFFKSQDKGQCHFKRLVYLQRLVVFKVRDVNCT